MNASDNTPSNGECVSGESFDYQCVGQELLQNELDRYRAELGRELARASVKASDGDLERDDLEALENSLLHGQHLLTMLRMAAGDE